MAGMPNAVRIHTSDDTPRRCTEVTSATGGLSFATIYNDLHAAFCAPTMLDPSRVSH